MSDLATEIGPREMRELLVWLTPDERAHAEKLIREMQKTWLWMPLPGPQLLAFNSKADVIGFGGAAGGGKSDLAIGCALQKHTNSAIFRREGTQLQGVYTRMTQLLGGRDGFNGQDKIWRIAGTDKIIEFGSCPNPGDEMRYQGRPKDLLVIDEAANFLESQVRFLMGWVRTVDPSIHCQTIMTFNPPTSSEGRWIVDYFAPWLDPTYPAPALPGELRFFAMVEGKEIEWPDNTPFYIKGELVIPKSRTFIPSKVGDNPYLVNTGYISTLQAMPEPLRSQMLYGDFQAGVMDDAFQVIPTHWVRAAMARWKKQIVKPPMDSMGVDVARGGKDRTVISRRHGWWFDELIALDGSATPDGQSVFAEVLKARRDQAVIHIDVLGVGASPYDMLKRVAQTVGVDVSRATHETDRSGRLGFFNVRSAIWWAMRELLDPEANNGISLPPDPELERELCTPTFKPDNGKIKVEGREDIIKRVGRSVDLATAVIQAAIQTPKRAALEATDAVDRRDYNPMDQVRKSAERARRDYDPLGRMR